MTEGYMTDGATALAVHTIKNPAVNILNLGF
jgi:hypothetical protein